MDVSQHPDVSEMDPKRGSGNGPERKNLTLLPYSNIWFIGFSVTGTVARYCSSEWRYNEKIRTMAQEKGFREGSNPGPSGRKEICPHGSPVSHSRKNIIAPRNAWTVTPGERPYPCSLSGPVLCSDFLSPVFFSERGKNSWYTLFRSSRSVCR